MGEPWHSGESAKIAQGWRLLNTVSTSKTSPVNLENQTKVTPTVDRPNLFHKIAFTLSNLARLALVSGPWENMPLYQASAAWFNTLSTLPATLDGTVERLSLHTIGPESCHGVSP